MGDPFPSQIALDELFSSVWGGPKPGFRDAVLSRSLCHAGAFEGDRLIGLVNVAWDGGTHAFLLDTCVHPEFRRQGIARDLVAQVTAAARAHGAGWLHVDFEPELEAFYRGCGFRPSAAGLIRL